MSQIKKEVPFLHHRICDEFCNSIVALNRLFPAWRTVYQKRRFLRQLLTPLRLADNQAFAGCFYDILGYLSQLIDLGYALNLSQ
jgi:hypothetical protein